MNPSTTTPTAADTRGPSTRTPDVPLTLGDTVLVCLEPGIDRPLVITAIVQLPIFARPSDKTPDRIERRISGTLFCEPTDHTTKAFRGALDALTDPARIHGRPDRYLPIAYAEDLAEGEGVGQWRRR